MAKFKKGDPGGPGRPEGSKNRRVWDDLQKALGDGETPLQFCIRHMRDPENSRDFQLECAKAIAPFVHRRRGVTDEGDETADQTIVIQVVDYGGGDAEALPDPDVIEGEATTVRVEGPD